MNRVIVNVESFIRLLPSKQVLYSGFQSYAELLHLHAIFSCDNRPEYFEWTTVQKKEKKNNFVLILLDSTKKKVSIIPTIVQSFFLHADDILSKRTDQE